MYGVEGSEVTASPTHDGGTSSALCQALFLLPFGVELRKVGREAAGAKRETRKRRGFLPGSFLPLLDVSKRSWGLYGRGVGTMQLCSDGNGKEAKLGSTRPLTYMDPSFQYVG